MSQGAILIENDDISSALWGYPLVLTGLVVSMVVNALVTGLIVFKIFNVFLEVKAASVEQTLGSLSSAGGPKLRHIMFIIIESGMALLAIQLVRVVMTILNRFQVQGVQTPGQPSGFPIALNTIITIHQALNVIIRSVHFILLFC